MSLTEELYQIADELRAVACLGRLFAKSHYDAENYERVLAASARLVAVVEQRSPDEVLTWLMTLATATRVRLLCLPPVST